jgi:mono/diheme cytochrome c family protein
MARSDDRRPAVLVPVGGVLLLIAALLAVVLLSGDAGDRLTVAEDGLGRIELTADQQAGRKLFAERCRSCHALAPANADGQAGPSLDHLRPPEAAVLEAIEHGKGSMPPDLARGEQARQIADFVAAVTAH